MSGIIERMFEERSEAAGSAVTRCWGDGGPEPEPPPAAPGNLDEDCFDDPAWLAQLVANDPDRPRSVAEILHDAEHGDITAALAADLTGIDPAGLTGDQAIALAIAAQRCANH